MLQCIIILCIFSCFAPHTIYACEEQIPIIETTLSSVESNKLKRFSYFPQGFYTFCKRPLKYPLITGPCSPCCALFISEVENNHALGFHIAANNSLRSVIRSIDTHFPSQTDRKRNLVATLFTHSNAKNHTEFTFQEGTHKDRFLTLFNILHSTYKFVDYRLYFNDTNQENYPEDRWIIYYGLDKNHQPTSSGVSFASKRGLDFQRYTYTIHRNKFGSLRALSRFLDCVEDAPLYKTNRHSRKHITSLNKPIHIVPFTDGILMQAFLPNDYHHLHLPMIIKGLADDWITATTAVHIISKLEIFMEKNEERLISKELDKDILGIVFKKEINSYFTPTDNGLVLNIS